MPRSLFKVGWRYLVGHPLQTLLMLLGISLGVAVAASVDVANASAARAFDLSVEAVTGRSTHYISAGPSGIPEGVYIELRRAGLGIPMAPILSQLVTSPDLGGAPLQLLGIDPFAEEPFRSYLYDENNQGDLAAMAAFYAVPGAVLISSDLAELQGLEINDAVPLNINGQIKHAFIAGLIEPRDALSSRALENLLLADISTVQEFSDKLGKLERIDLILPLEGQDELISLVEDYLPPGAVILPAEGRSQAAEQLTTAFQTNLTALSLLGLTVGLFLIYNTMTFSVVQRRQSFGTLRALGVTGREIFTIVLTEAFLVGLVGSVFGVVIGVGFGRGAVDLVTQTINDNFFATTVREVSLPVESLVRGGILGLATTLFAALIPAWEAANSPPRRTLSRSQLEANVGGFLGWVGLLGASMALGSALLLAFVDLTLGASFGGIFGLTVGLALTVPWITRQIMPAAAVTLGRLFGPLGRMAPREVSNSASRTSPAMAALMLAVAVTIGASLMVSSFRASVIDWLEVILSNDIYGSVATASLAEPAVALDPAIVEGVQNWPGVEAVHLLRNAQVDSPYGPITVSANDNPNDGAEQIYVEIDGAGAEAWEHVKNGAIMISEPLANRLDLTVGDDLILYTRQGEHAFPIIAVIQDFSSSRGGVTMWLGIYRQFWEDETVTAFSARVASSEDIDTLISKMRRELGTIQLLKVRSNQALRIETLVVFDRSFLITSALQLIITVVAFVGVLSAMLSLQLEKQRQLGILKAIGLSGAQMWTLVLLETSIIGAVAGLLALPTGALIAQILLRLINRLSFGWTLQIHLEVQPFLQAMLVAVGAALLAGLYPALRASNRSAAEAMRFD